MNHITLIGIDTAKTVFHLHAVDSHGKKVYQKKLTREKLLAFIGQCPPCVVALEACTACHYWAREFSQRGHTVRLISARRVQSFTSRNKNDFNDARAITKAARDPDTYFVAPKSIEQQAIQALHTTRATTINQQTALVNATRALLAEFGLVVPQGREKLMQALPLILEDADNSLPDLVRALIAENHERLRQFREAIKRYDRKLEQYLKQSELAQRFDAIPGVGVLISTAMTYAMPDPQVYKNGRQFAACLGLTPKEHSSGGKQRMGKLSKEGNPYLRKILVQGAHALLQRAHRKTDALSQWAARLKQTKPINLVAIALANKIARISWSMAAHHESFHYPRTTHPRVNSVHDHQGINE